MAGHLWLNLDLPFSLKILGHSDCLVRYLVFYPLGFWLSGLWVIGSYHWVSALFCPL